jgi:hypothetical protein
VARIPHAEVLRQHMKKYGLTRQAVVDICEASGYKISKAYIDKCLLKKTAKSYRGDIFKKHLLDAVIAWCKKYGTVKTN